MKSFLLTAPAADKAYTKQNICRPEAVKLLREKKSQD